MNWCWKEIALIIIFLSCIPNKIVRAQLIPDNTLGTENSTVQTVNDIQQIDGGAIRQTNLFHSFQEFNVGDGARVYFSNPVDVLNIFTRVTGNNISNILGTLGVFGNANLFLLNPNGIVFGPNASLDLRGSFLGTTAESFIFNNTEYSALNPQSPPLLTVNIPIGLRFRDNFAPIEVNGQGQIFGLNGVENSFPIANLEVLTAQNLILLGGDINLNGGVLQAPGGQIVLGGLSAAGNISLDGFEVVFPDNVSRSDLNIGSASGINAIGGVSGGGKIVLNGRNINISDGSLITTGLAKDLGNLDVPLGLISFQATDETRIDGSRVENNVNFNTINDSGNIVIESGSFVLTNQGNIDASNLGEDLTKVAGSIDITVRDDILIQQAQIFSDGFFGAIFLQSNTGNVAIENSDITSINSDNNLDGSLFNQIYITSLLGSVVLKEANIEANNFGTGFAGDIIIDAFKNIDILGKNISTQGNSGNIIIGRTILPEQIIIEASIIEASNSGNGLAGDIIINATNNVNISTSNISAKGNSGNIIIGDKSFPNRIAIATSNLINNNENYLDGLVGQISLQGNQIFIKESNLNSVNFGSSNGGLVEIKGIELVEFNNSKIFTNLEGNTTGESSQAGDIIIKVSAGSFSLLDGSQLQSLIQENASGQAGDVTIFAAENITISGFFDSFSTAIFNNVVVGGNGDSGKIEIQGKSIILNNQAILQSQNPSGGLAGNITLNASESIVIANRAEINSSSKNDLNDFNQIILNAELGSIAIENSTIEASNSGTGFAADILINAKENVNILGSNISARGNQGNILIGNDILPKTIAISSQEIITSQLSTNNENSPDKNVGKISILASDEIQLNNSQLNSTTFGAGNGGEISLEAKQIFIEQSNLDSDTNGAGDAGLISILSNNLLKLTSSSLNSIASNLGNAGIIALEGAQIFIENTNLDSATFASGNAGAVSILGTELIEIKNANVFSDVSVDPEIEIDENIIPQAGNIIVDISNGSIFILDNSLIQAQNRRGGLAGDVSINANNSIVITDSTINSKSISNITDLFNHIELNAMQGSIAIQNSIIEAGNSGSGFAADIIINAHDRLDISDSTITSDGFLGQILINDPEFGFTAEETSFLVREILIKNSVLTTTNGQAIAEDEENSLDAGNITINALSNIQIINHSIITALTANQGNGGSITINTKGDILLDGVSLINANIDPETDGAILQPVLGGDIAINARSLNVLGGSEILAQTNGLGNAGSITVNTIDFVNISGVAPYPIIQEDFAGGFSSGLISSSEANAGGDGGRLLITTKKLTISDGAVLSARSRSAFAGGNIQVIAEDVELLRGGQILSTGFTEGNAGTVTLSVANNLTLKDIDPTFKERFNLVKNTFDELTAQTTIDPVNEQAGLFANTQQNTGGDMEISVGNLTLLRGNSTITTNAGQEGTGGDGGNIKITTKLLIAFPIENSDITANAFDGKGGAINITTQGLFGLEFRERLTPLSDITAFSELNPELNGEITLNTPDADPSQGLVELEQNVVDPNNLLAQNPCQEDNKSSFIVTGKGGFPTNPNNFFNSEATQVDLVKPIINSNNIASTNSNLSRENVTSKQVIPAQGWIFNDKGQVTLTAYKIQQIPFQRTPTTTDSNICN